MKTFYATLALCFMTTLMAMGQTCKILISYDQNGNRIKREEDCTLLPSSAEETPPYTQNGQQEQETFMDGVAGTEAGIKFHVYPNPASQSVTVSLDAASLKGHCTLVLTDQLSKEHYRKEVHTSLTTIPLEHLADGLYYVLVHRHDRQDVVKIVKEANGGW